MKEQYARLQAAAERLIEVQQAVWFYYRPHLVSITVERNAEWNDSGYSDNFDASYITIESTSDDDLWLDEPYITTRKEESLEFIHPYIDFSDGYPWFDEDIPPAALHLALDDSITLTNPNYTLEQIEALICEF